MDDHMYSSKLTVHWPLICLSVLMCICVLPTFMSMYHTYAVSEEVRRVIDLELEL